MSSKNSARAFALAKSTDGSRLLKMHRLGNGFIALEGANTHGMNELTVHCEETGESYPHVLAAALGMDLTGDGLVLDHMPKDIDILSRLRAITCYKRTDAPRLVQS